MTELAHPTLLTTPPPESGDRSSAPTRTSEIRRLAAFSVGHPASPYLRYGLPVAVWIATIFVSVVVGPLIAHANFAFIWPAILFAAWYAGFSTALVISVASIVAVDFFFVGGRTFIGPSSSDFVVLLSFLISAVAISALSTRLRHAQRLLEAAAEDLSERNAELEDAAVQSEQLAAEAQSTADQIAAVNRELHEANRQLEEARSLAEAAAVVAQTANRAKADFLAAMSHETRQPLNATLAFLQLLEMGTYGELSVEQRTALDKVRRNQQQLLSIITDILTFARLEAGRVSLQKLPVRVADILHDLPAAVEPQMVSHQLTLKIEPCDPAIRLVGDPDRIHQICVNLLTNAIRATGPGGAISVHSAADATTVKIQVADTGVGIAADKLDRIFEPFVQLDRALNRPKEGVGLGLTISRDLARAMDGDLSATSVVGRGSVFTLTLPRTA